MPVQKISFTHRFGIISSSYKQKIEKDIEQKSQESDRSSSTNSSNHTKKHLLLEVTEEFVRDYNKASASERIKQNEVIYRMLQRLKRKATQLQMHTERSMQLQMTWAELCLLSQCKSSYQEECLTTLYRALVYSPLNMTQIPTLFFLSETILYWIKNDAILEPFLTSTELKLLKIAQIIFQLLYYHYLEGSTEPYEELKIRLSSYLDGLEECESAYSSYPNAVWCIRYIESVGSVLVASVGKHALSSRRNTSSVANFPIPQIPPEDLDKTTNKSELRTSVQELSPILWHSVNLWSFAKKYSTNSLTETMNRSFNEIILSLINCRYELLNENWIDVVITFQILADIAKTNVDILETIQLLAQSESTTQLPVHKQTDNQMISHGWRSWSWKLIVHLCECLTSICIGTEQALIKRKILFGNETSSDNILAYARNINTFTTEPNTVSQNTIETGKRSFLQKLRDLIYAGAAFPIGMYVCIAFWGISHVDRELIYPKELDGLVSPVLNHVMHTLPGVALCLENLVHYHRYPSRLLGLTLVISLFAAYTTWIHYLHHIHWLAFKVSLWVYPILNELSFTYRGLFFLGSALFGIGLYFIGEMYTLMLTSLRIDRAGRNKKKY
ncbi:unnamed protein product [Adineta steineri]|uniref:Uncharacterized protein n=1 Tax=Adineta steineri TaxID=433720 RepID=A0A814R3B0_9BILA|nr:unnamed protein product [Adineta steineri]